MFPHCKQSPIKPELSRNAKGFTLLEVLVAATMLAIALLAMGTGELNSIGTSRLSRDVTTMTASGQEIIERIRRNKANVGSYNGFDTNNSATRPASPGILQDDYDQWKSNLTGAVSGSRGQVTVTPSSPLATTNQVSVTITWPSAPLTKTITIQTVFSN
jgi:prepilin-type N-terminal cleavage/methylation domain-containing protein